MPIRLRDWPDVLEFVGPVPYFAMDIQVDPEAGKSSLSSGVYALSEEADRMSLLEDSYRPSGGTNLGLVGLGDWRVEMI